MSLLFPHLSLCRVSPRMLLQHNFPNKTTGEMINTPAVTSIDNYEYTDATKEGGQQPHQAGGRVVLNSPHPELPPQLPVIYAGELAWVTRAAAPPATAPPTLPFDTATQFRAAVHQHSASPLCTNPACTYYNGTRAVDVAGQRRHDVAQWWFGRNHGRTDFWQCAHPGCKHGSHDDQQQYQLWFDAELGGIAGCDASDLVGHGRYG